MGYDVTRFQGEVDEDLLCPICSGVLEEPVQAGPCSAYLSSFLWNVSHVSLCFRPHTVNMHSVMRVSLSGSPSSRSAQWTAPS